MLVAGHWIASDSDGSAVELLVPRCSPPAPAHAAASGSTVFEWVIPKDVDTYRLTSGGQVYVDGVAVDDPLDNAHWLRPPSRNDSWDSFARPRAIPRVHPFVGIDEFEMAKFADNWRREGELRVNFG